MDRMKTASVQFNHKPGDKGYNFGKIIEFVELAADEKVDLIVFPEMCITGYWHVRNLSKPEIESLAEPIPSGPSTQKLLLLSREHNMTIGAGLIESTKGGDLYNTYVVAMPNGQIAHHR